MTTFTITTSGGSSIAGLEVGQEIVVEIDGVPIKISINKVEENGGV